MPINLSSPPTVPGASYPKPTYAHLLAVVIRVKRSLKLDNLSEANMIKKRKEKKLLSIFKSFDPSKVTRNGSIKNYSPTTGTCQISPFASPTSCKEQKHENGPSNGKRKKLNHLSLIKRKESTTKDDELMVLLSKVEKSSEDIVEIMQSLSTIQALEGSRKLENLIGISCGSCFLKREILKTKELMTKATKQMLFEEKSSELSNKELRHLDSYEFLKAILN